MLEPAPGRTNGRLTIGEPAVCGGCAGTGATLSSAIQLRELDDVLSRRTLGALNDIELNPLAFGE